MISSPISTHSSGLASLNIDQMHEKNSQKVMKLQYEKRKSQEDHDTFDLDFLPPTSHVQSISFVRRSSTAAAMGTMIGLGAKKNFAMKGGL